MTYRKCKIPGNISPENNQNGNGVAQQKQQQEPVFSSVPVPRNLRILLINTKVARNTKSLVAKVREERYNLLPKITGYILDAMDRVSRDCIDTFASLVNNNVNNNNTGNGSELAKSETAAKSVGEENERQKSLFHKLEVIIFSI